MHNTNNSLGINKSMSIENHVTAPLSDIESVLPESRVPVSDDEAVNMAKEWVDTNEK